MAPAALQLFFMLSPPAAFAIAFQDVLFWGRVPETLVLLTLLGWTATSLVGGHVVFRRYSPAFAEET
jgi:ABC-type polysaccharide/polyol phosphate export permease